MNVIVYTTRRHNEEGQNFQLFLYFFSFYSANNLAISLLVLLSISMRPKFQFSSNEMTVLTVGVINIGRV